MTFNPETQLVSSRVEGETCHYQIRAAGKVWDVAIPIHELDAFGPVHGADAVLNAQKRREHLGRKLMEVMRG